MLSIHMNDDDNKCKCDDTLLIYWSHEDQCYGWLSGFSLRIITGDEIWWFWYGTQSEWQSCKLPLPPRVTEVPAGLLERQGANRSLSLTGRALCTTSLHILEGQQENVGGASLSVGDSSRETSQNVPSQRMGAPAAQFVTHGALLALQHAVNYRAWYCGASPPTVSSHLTPCDSYLFLPMKNWLNGCHLNTAADVQVPSEIGLWEVDVVASRNVSDNCMSVCRCV